MILLISELTSRQVYLACGSTDLRRSIDGLAVLVQEGFQLDPFDSCLFAFCNKKRDKLKTRCDWIKEAQAAFNRYIRLRDAGKPCICCGRPLEGGAIGGGFDAGHYRSVGSAPHLRFDERNVHGQTKQCNRYGAGRAVDYRIGLIARIGREAVEELEADQKPRKHTIEDLIEIRNTYRAKAKEIDG